MPDAAQTSRASQSTAQHSTAQHSTAQHSTAQHSTAYPQSVAATQFANGDKNGQIHDSRPGGRADP
ncbi:hypothetical protein F5985_03960 [Malikia spinosa]|uniref:Uncharacterized protein n=1 Tax=Malikia spinosa TaxID=86180 RepID=A0A7C9J4Y1_9BURK|nr:hypothetical protein [Malikia spinosa]